jgi:N-acetylneuraminic acid mutarotase
MPAALWGAAAVCRNGKIYLTGGIDDQLQPVATIYEFEPSAFSWRELGPMSHPRTYHQAIAQGDSLMIIGGFDPGQAGGAIVLATTEWYDLARDTVFAGPQLLCPRLHFSIATFANKAYIAGGQQSMIAGSVLGSIERYDPNTGAWSDAAMLPGQRLGAASAVSDGAIYLFGGATTDNFPKPGQTDACVVYYP